MPRDVSGTYTLPGGINPVVAGTLIESNWANTTLADIAAALTDSLSRTGLGGMTGAFRFADGSKPAPGIAWTNETTVGFYRATTGDMRVAIANADIQTWTGALVTIDVPTLVDSTLRLTSAFYMPNSASIYMKDAASADMSVLVANVSDEVLHGLGASWVRHYFYCAGVIKFTIEAAAVAVATNLTVTGNITTASALIVGTTLSVIGVATFTAAIDLVDGIYSISNNRSIYFRAVGDPTGYAVLGVNITNDITIGATVWPTIIFSCAGSEHGRFTSSGAFKATTSGGYIAAASVHELIGNNAGNYTAQIVNFAAALPFGLDITFDAFPGGSRGYLNYYHDCRDTAGAVFSVASNGGVLNYSALNVNLSDARAKRDIDAGYDFTPFVERLVYKRFKYADMPQTGEVIGLIAQEVEQYAPELVVQKALNDMKGVREQQVQQRINSIIPRLIARIKHLEEIAGL